MDSHYSPEGNILSRCCRASLLLGRYRTALVGDRGTRVCVCVNNLQYNTIQYKTYNAPYVTKILFVGAGMTRD